MAGRIGVEVVRVRRAAPVDRLSSEVSVATEHDIRGCEVLPRTAQTAERGWVVVEGRMVVAPYGADVTEDDQVWVDGRWWHVDGPPAHWARRGRGKATVFYLRSVS